MSIKHPFDCTFNSACAMCEKSTRRAYDLAGSCHIHLCSVECDNRIAEIFGGSLEPEPEDKRKP